MALKPVECIDDRGQQWMVYEGDPAWGLVRRLWMHGVREVVLPRRTLRTGELVDVRIPANLSAWDVSNPAVAELLRRYVRLHDCTRWLS